MAYGVMLQMQWLTELPNTVHSCSRHGVVAARLSTERPGSVTPSKGHIQCKQRYIFLRGA
jgi:hypothetical protein